MTTHARSSVRGLALLAAVAIAGCDAPADLSVTPTPDPVSVDEDPTSNERPVGDADVAYWSNEYIVGTSRPSGLAAAVERAGGKLLRPVGVSGYALVRADDDGVNRLLEDPSITRLVPNGRIRGAASGSGSYRGLQWHLDALGEPQRHTTDFSAVTVAVLDSGASYATGSHDGRYHVRSTGLNNTTIVSPYDFVNDDSVALDDHQHGTHVATAALGDAATMGTAPTASLMPVKVLDANNEGSEYSLIEGLAWATLYGADVINMSLAFPPNYLPSQPLREALTDASDADIVLVAAAGNDAADLITWPAAHPGVIAVGASTTTATALAPTSYSNLGMGVDLLAPGGDTSIDADSDGYPDGVLAHAFSLNQPSSTGYLFMAGTSQASALVSGIVAQLLEDGVAPSDVHHTLQLGASAGSAPFTLGLGAGYLDSSDALTAPLPTSGPTQVHIGLLPFLADQTTQVAPRARVVALDQSGNVIVGAEVLVTAVNNSGADWLSCTTNNAGQCTVSGSPQPPSSDQATMFRVDAVVIGGNRSLHPNAVLFDSAEFNDLVAALDSDPKLAGLPIGIGWSTGTDPYLGDLAESYAVIDSGAGMASLPLGLLLPSAAIGGLSRNDTTISLQGDTVDVSTIEIGGSGLAALPFGLRYADFNFVSGSGLATLPFGLHPGRIHLGLGTATPVWLDTPSASPAAPGQAIAARLANGGWGAHGYPAASYATSASGVSVPTGSSNGASVQAVWFAADE